jgi:hypothetical protein
MKYLPIQILFLLSIGLNNTMLCLVPDINPSSHHELLISNETAPESSVHLNGETVDGCTDSTACNYNVNATDDDGSCKYRRYVDFDGDGKGSGEAHCLLLSDVPQNYVSESGDDCPYDSLKTNAGSCGCGTSDTDSDGDSVADCVDECPFDKNKQAEGTCGCGTPDTDSDGDTVSDCQDECPNNAALSAADTVCGCNSGGSAHSDTDGIPDCLDNCPTVSNTDQLDANGNGIGDECERKGCTIATACNYDELAHSNDGSCILPGECTVCDNVTQKIDVSIGASCKSETGACQTLDAIGECGGDCLTDADEDGICDDNNGDACQQVYNGSPCSIDPQSELYDENCPKLDVCGECDGAGIPLGDCDCNKNKVNNCGVCGGAPVDKVYWNCDGTCVEDPNDSDTVCEIEELDGCMDDSFCNYNSDANIQENATCLTVDDCGICGGSSVFTDANGSSCAMGSSSDCLNPAGHCDCAENTIDALGVCGGGCAEDKDGDGICDSEEVMGCTLTTACNYDAAAGITEDLMVDPLGAACSYTYQNNGGNCNPADCADSENCDCVKVYATDCVSVCAVEDVLLVCGGKCEADLDNDGICDRSSDGSGLIDDCVGTIDACGICNGTSTFQREVVGGACNPGTFIDTNGEDCQPGTDGCYACTATVTLYDGDPIEPNYQDANGHPCMPGTTGCSDSNSSSYPGAVTLSGVCNCRGDQYDALGICGGTCLSDPDHDGVCDLNEFNTALDPGEGDLADTPCTLDTDNDGLCEDEDENGDIEDFCPDDGTNIQDVCGICDGPGIPEGFCDCASTLHKDALGDCWSSLTDAGYCSNDVDHDNVCDSVDPCVGEFDDCGICNGTSVYSRNGEACTPGTFLDGDGNDCVPGTAGCNACTIAIYVDNTSDQLCDLVYKNSAGELCVEGTPDCSLETASISNCNLVQSCDCLGNDYDVIGVCNGNCTQDNDQDGVCDLDSAGNIVDTCDGVTNACGVCNGGEPDPECGCEPVAAGFCDCQGNTEDECGGCGGTGKLPYRECDKTCENPVEPARWELYDEQGISTGVLCTECSDDTNPDCANCLRVCQEEIEVTLTEPLTINVEVQNGAIKVNQELEPVIVNTALMELTNLHARMTENLDDGSPTSNSLHVTIEDKIQSNGILNVSRKADLNHATILGNLNIGTEQDKRNIYITGSATVEGVTLAEGRVRSQYMQVRSDVNSAGSATLKNKLNVEGNTTFNDQLHIGNDLRISKTSDPNITTFLVSSANGDVIKSGDLTVRQTITANAKSILNNIELNRTGVFATMNAKSDLILDASTITAVGSEIPPVNADFNGDFTIRTNETDRFKVDLTTGNETVLVGGDLTVLGDSVVVSKHILVEGNVDIDGTLFSRSGVETKSLTIDEDVTAYGSGIFGLGLYVDGRTRLRSPLSTGGNFTIYPSNAVSADIWQDEALVDCIPSYELIGGDPDDPTDDCVPGPGVSGCFPVYPIGCTLKTKGTFTDAPTFNVVSSTGDGTINGTIGVDGTFTATTASNISGNITVNTNPASNPPINNELEVGGALTVHSLSSATPSSSNTFTGLTTITSDLSTPGININGVGRLQAIGKTSLQNLNVTGSGTTTFGTASSSAGQLEVYSTASSVPFSITGNGHAYAAEFVAATTTTSSGGGIEITLGVPQPNSDFDYVTFKGKNQANAPFTMGAIQGIRSDEWSNHDGRTFDLAGANTELHLSGSAAKTAGIDLAIAAGNYLVTSVITTAEALAFAPCAGIVFYGPFPFPYFCGTTPPPAAAANLMEQIVDAAPLAVAIANMLKAGFSAATAAIFKNNVTGTYDGDMAKVNSAGTETNWVFPESMYSGTRVGVMYESGSGDYAEWLPKENPKQNFQPGQIVGSFNGRISNITQDCEKLFVITDRPIILGGEMSPELQSTYTPAAFKGQVPVYVKGKVAFGDVIVASGRNDGVGYATKRSKVSPKNYNQIVGVAWESNNSNRIKRVNCAVGVEDFSGNNIVSLNNSVRRLNQKSKYLKDITSSLLDEGTEDSPASRPDGLDYIEFSENTVNRKEDGSVSLNKVSDDEISQAYEMVRAHHVSQGESLETHPFWSQYDSSEEFRRSWNDNYRKMINEHNQWIKNVEDQYRAEDMLRLRYSKEVGGFVDTSTQESSTPQKERKKNRTSRTKRDLKKSQIR